MNCDLTEFCLVDAVGGGGDVPMVEQNATALVAGDADVDLRIWAEVDLGVD